MPGALPPVLITNTETISEEIDNPDRVQVEDVARLWRVYTLNSAHIDDDEGARLENFFWRIWSNPRIVKSIRGNTLARLFITISEGGNRVRTTPVPTPLASTPTQSATYSQAPVSPARVSYASTERHDQPLADASTLSTEASPRKVSDQSRTLPPILKKSRTGLVEPPKSAKIVSPDAQRREAVSKARRSGSSESIGPLSPPAGSEDRGSKNAGKKKTSFTAPSGSKKSRPGVMRKRSSQSSTSSEQRRSSQTFPLGLQPSRIPPKSATGLPPATTIGNFALPSSSWQDVDSPASSRTSLDNAFATTLQPSSWLVDKNFRGKFVENQKRATSSVNLAALGKSQSVRFLDELPEHARTAAKGKARADKFDIDEDSEPGSPLAASPAIEESEDEDQPALPRTKSQLSMLIDKERKYSGGINIGSEPPKRGNRKGDSAEKKEDDGEDNELLMMARRDKKGKPKDPDQPFKAAAQKGLWKGGGGGPGSPPPIF